MCSSQGSHGRILQTRKPYQIRKCKKILASARIFVLWCGFAGVRVPSPKEKPTYAIISVRVLRSTARVAPTVVLFIIHYSFRASLPPPRAMLERSEASHGGLRRRFVRRIISPLRCSHILGVLAGQAQTIYPPKNFPFPAYFPTCANIF